MGSTIIKIFSGEHASEPPKTALAQILWGGLFRLEGGLFGARSPLRKFLRAPMSVPHAFFTCSTNLAGWSVELVTNTQQLVPARSVSCDACHVTSLPVGYLKPQSFILTPDSNRSTSPCSSIVKMFHCDGELNH